MSQSKTHTEVVTPATGGHNTTLGYTIAAITMAAAVGNMFMGGRIRNIMKMKVPDSSSWKNQTKYRHTKAEPEKEFVKRTVNMSNPLYTIPPHIAADLHLLQLPARVVSEAEIKEAYRKAVMKYHPDRVQTESDKIRRSHEAKFKDATDSYNTLLEHFVKSEE